MYSLRSAVSLAGFVIIIFRCETIAHVAGHSDFVLSGRKSGPRVESREQEKRQL